MMRSRNNRAQIKLQFTLLQNQHIYAYWKTVGVLPLRISLTHYIDAVHHQRTNKSVQCEKKKSKQEGIRKALGCPSKDWDTPTAHQNTLYRRKSDQFFNDDRHSNRKKNYEHYLWKRAQNEHIAIMCCLIWVFIKHMALFTSGLGVTNLT